MALVASGQTTAEQRKQDLQFVLRELPARHPNFYNTTPKAVVDAAGLELDGLAGTVTDEVFYTKLAGLVALGRDAHTTMALTGSEASALGFRLLPVQFVTLEDGVFVAGAAVGRRELLGAQLLRSGGVGVSAVLERLRPVLAYETSGGCGICRNAALANLGVLKGVGLVVGSGGVRMKFRLVGGVEQTVELRVTGEPVVRSAEQVGGYLVPQLRRRGELYWAEYWPENRAIYVAYRCVRNRRRSRLSNLRGRLRRWHSSRWMR